MGICNNDTNKFCIIKKRQILFFIGFLKFYKEGLLYAARISFNIVNSVFQIIPQMIGTMHTITDTQRSRGMETEGNIFVRIRAVLPLISPVVMSALTATRDRAIAFSQKEIPLPSIVSAKTQSGFETSFKIQQLWICRMLYR